MSTTTANIDTGSTLHEETQRVVRSLAERDIYTMCNEMMGILNSHTYVDYEGGPSLPTADDLAPVMSRPDYSEAPEGYTVRFATGVLAGFEGESLFDDGWEWINEETNERDGRYSTEREAIEAAWDDSGDEPPHEEALQFWLVSSQLARELETEGALVARDAH